MGQLYIQWVTYSDYSPPLYIQRVTLYSIVSDYSSSYHALCLGLDCLHVCLCLHAGPLQGRQGLYTRVRCSVRNQGRESPSVRKIPRV